jgi:hypothetical protein
MKLAILFVGILFLTQKSMAQFSELTVDAPSLPNLTATPCSEGNIGKLYYNAVNGKVCYCINYVNSSSFAESKWERKNNNIYYTKGLVGINKSTPAYPLDVNGTGRFNSPLSVGAKVAINSSVPPVEKLHITDGNIAIRSTADAKLWRLSYADGGDRFEITETGFTPRMIINNGGAIGIGTVPSTAALNVSGGGAFSGNVSSANVGMLQNSNATQLKLYTGSITTPSSTFLVQSNGCNVAGFNFPSGTFTAVPAVTVGNKTAGDTFDQRLTLTVESVTSTGGYVRFCNPTATNVSLLSYSYTIIAIGQ